MNAQTTDEEKGKKKNYEVKIKKLGEKSRKIMKNVWRSWRRPMLSWRKRLWSKRGQTMQSSSKAWMHWTKKQKRMDDHERVGDPKTEEDVEEA